MRFYNDNLKKYIHKEDFPKDFLTELAETLRNTADFPELSRDALALLCLAAFFSPEAVPVEWFEDVTGFSESGFQAALEQLEGYGLLVPGNTGTKRYRLLCPVPLEIPRNCIFRKKCISKIRHKFEDDILLRNLSYWYNSRDSWQIGAMAEFYKDVYQDWSAETEESELDLNFSWAFGILGSMYFTLGEMNSSKEMYQIFHTICAARAEAMPDCVDVQRDWGGSLDFLGDLEKERGNREAARNYNLKSLEIRERLANLMPEDTGALQDLSISCERLGDMEYDDQRMTSARTYYVKNLEIRERIAEYMPGRELVLRNLSAAYDRLGDVESYDENWDVARELFTKAMHLREQILPIRDENIRAQRDLCISWNKLGDVCNATGDLEGAQEYYLKWIKTYEQHAKAFPQFPEYLFELMHAYRSMALLLPKESRLTEKLRWYGKCVKTLKCLAANFPRFKETEKWLLIIMKELELLSPKESFWRYITRILRRKDSET